MRVFISIELPEGIIREIKKIQEKLPEFSGKKTELENLHLTLKFLGEISKEKVEEIRKRLGKINLNKINCEIDNLGFFSPSFIRIIWVHLKWAEELQKAVDKSLSGLFEKEERFMGHITIARVKNIKNKKKFIEELGKINFKKMNFVVDRFYLKESVLKPEGPEYKIIEEFILKK